MCGRSGDEQSGAFYHFNYKADIAAARMHKSEYVAERWRSRSKKDRRNDSKETIMRVDSLNVVHRLLALCKSRRGCGFLRVSEE